MNTVFEGLTVCLFFKAIFYICKYILLTIGTSHCDIHAYNIHVLAYTHFSNIYCFNNKISFKKLVKKSFIIFKYRFFLHNIYYYVLFNNERVHRIKIIYFIIFKSRIYVGCRNENHLYCRRLHIKIYKHVLKLNSYKRFRIFKNSKNTIFQRYILFVLTNYSFYSLLHFSDTRFDQRPFTI